MAALSLGSLARCTPTVFARCFGDALSGLGRSIGLSPVALFAPQNGSCRIVWLKLSISSSSTGIDSMSFTTCSLDLGVFSFMGITKCCLPLPLNLRLPARPPRIDVSPPRATGDALGDTWLFDRLSWSSLRPCPPLSCTRKLVVPSKGFMSSPTVQPEEPAGPAPEGVAAAPEAPEEPAAPFASAGDFAASFSVWLAMIFLLMARSAFSFMLASLPKSTAWPPPLSPEACSGCMTRARGWLESNIELYSVRVICSVSLVSGSSPCFTAPVTASRIVTPDCNLMTSMSGGSVSIFSKYLETSFFFFSLLPLACLFLSSLFFILDLFLSLWFSSASVTTGCELLSLILGSSVIAGIFSALRV
mmetsp:Transcript_8084/g.14997  ORF Transcript_8084/g.14997 Transcript_8084/m.14997 type:complete len:360 (-) Transcript_8084:819-1898(-)